MALFDDSGSLLHFRPYLHHSVGIVADEHIRAHFHRQIIGLRRVFRGICGSAEMREHLLRVARTSTIQYHILPQLSQLVHRVALKPS